MYVCTFVADTRTVRGSRGCLTGRGESLKRAKGLQIVRMKCKIQSRRQVCFVFVDSHV